MDYIVSLLLMFSLLFFQFLKYQNVPFLYIEKIKLIVQALFFFIALTLRILISLHFILPNNIENTMKILFLLFSYSTVIRTIQRFVKLVKYTITIIFLFFLTALFFSIYFRVRFDGIFSHDQESEIYYQISFVSITRSFYTMLNSSFLQTIPELPQFLEETCLFSYMIFWIYIFLSGVILISLITSIFFFIY